jgi:integrase
MLSKQLYKALESHKINIAPETYATYTGMLNRFTDWLNDNDYNQCEPAEFIQGQAIAFINSLEGLHNTTRTSYRNNLRAIFNMVIHSGQKFDNPFSEVKLKTVSHTQSKRAFTPEEIAAIKIHCQQKNLEEEWMVFQMIFYCMLRPRKELRLLKVGDIDLKQQKIVVRAENAKNGKQEYVAIPTQLVNPLQEWIAKKELKPFDYLFMNENKTKPRGEDWFSRRCREILDTLGMDNRVSLYSWKHTGVVYFYQHTKDIVSVQRQVRHANLAETQGYLHSLGLIDNEMAKNNFPTL